MRGTGAKGIPVTKPDLSPKYYYHMLMDGLAMTFGGLHFNLNVSSENEFKAVRSRRDPSLCPYFVPLQPEQFEYRRAADTILRKDKSSRDSKWEELNRDIGIWGHRVDTSDDTPTFPMLPSENITNLLVN